MTNSSPVPILPVNPINIFETPLLYCCLAQNIWSVLGHVGTPVACNFVKLEDVADMNYFSVNNEGEVGSSCPALRQSEWGGLVQKELRAAIWLGLASTSRKEHKIVHCIFLQWGRKRLHTVVETTKCVCSEQMFNK